MRKRKEKERSLLTSSKLKEAWKVWNPLLIYRTRKEEAQIILFFLDWTSSDMPSYTPLSNSCSKCCLWERVPSHTYYNTVFVWRGLRPDEYILVIVQIVSSMSTPRSLNPCLSVSVLELHVLTSKLPLADHYDLHNNSCMKNPGWLIIYLSKNSIVEALDRSLCI